MIMVPFPVKHLTIRVNVFLEIAAKFSPESTHAFYLSADNFNKRGFILSGMAIARYLPWKGSRDTFHLNKK